MSPSFPRKRPRHRLAMDWPSYRKMERRVVRIIKLNTEAKP